MLIGHGLYDFAKTQHNSHYIKGIHTPQFFRVKNGCLAETNLRRQGPEGQDGVSAEAMSLRGRDILVWRPDGLPNIPLYMRGGGRLISRTATVALAWLPFESLAV